jgi:hypothetical protein
MGEKPDTDLPAVCLMITGALNAALGFLAVGSRFKEALGRANDPALARAARIANVVGIFIVQLPVLLDLVAAPLIIYGAVKMFNGSSYGWAKAASILAIIPFTSCCFLIGAPTGIWALVVSSKPKAKLFYGRGGANHQPPGPPQYHSST